MTSIDTPTESAPIAPAVPSPSVDEASYDEWVHHPIHKAERRYRIATMWIWLLIFRLKAYGVEHIPKEGAFVLAPNHASYIDPFVHAAGQRRLVRFMAKASMFTTPILRNATRAGGGFPVQRGVGDRFAIELGKRILADGQPLCVYAEGTRFRTDAKLGPPRRGAARFALEMGVPVVPCASWGNKPRKARGKRGWGWPKVTTMYGWPMHFDGVEATPENVARVRDEIWAEVTRLHDLAREITERKGRRPKHLEIPRRPER